MKAWEIGFVLFFALLFFIGCGSGSAGDGNISADNGSTVIVGSDITDTDTVNSGDGTVNNNIGGSQGSVQTLADCKTCCDLCEGDNGDGVTDGECKDKCVEDLRCEKVLTAAPQCISGDGDNNEDEEPEPDPTPELVNGGGLDQQL